MSLANILKAHKATKRKKTGGADPGGVLIPAIRKHFDERPTRAPDGLLHASQAKDYCPRAVILAEVYGVSLPVFKPGLQLSTTFDIGHAVHSRFQNEVLGTAGVIIGRWKCQCGNIVGGQTPTSWTTRPVICPRGCPKPDYRFKESTAVDTKYKIIGSTDGGVFLPTGEIIGLEIKTISKAGFEGLGGVTPDHIIQANIYLALFALQRQVFLYVSKGWHGFNESTRIQGDGLRCGPYFEVMFNADPHIINTLRAQREQEFRAREAWKAGNEVYPDFLPVCGQKTASRVKSCPVGEVCMDLR